MITIEKRMITFMYSIFAETKKRIANSAYNLVNYSYKLRRSRCQNSYTLKWINQRFISLPETSKNKSNNLINKKLAPASRFFFT